jgi:hypothetical protein
MENRLKRKLADDALTFCLGVNQARTPNVAMIDTAVGFDQLAAISAGITPIARLGARYLRARNDVQDLLRGARADIGRMKTLPVQRQ